MSDSTPPPAAPASPPSPASADEGAKRYAVYDTLYEKFVGTVVDKKPSRAAAEKLVGHDEFDIREV